MCTVEGNWKGDADCTTTDGTEDCCSRTIKLDGAEEEEEERDYDSAAAAVDALQQTQPG